jgi:serine/threonine protein kinase
MCWFTTDGYGEQMPSLTCCYDDCCPQVVLKEFDLRLAVRGAGRDGSGDGLRTLQREVEHLARLQHPCILSIDLYFLEPDDDACAGLGDDCHDSRIGAEAAKTRLRVFVQFPWFPTDMERWLATDEATAAGGVAAGRVIALDVLWGLEHVHKHGVVHCDVKPANVLLTAARSEGLRRAVLADFDLSQDQQARASHASRAATVRSMANGHGTPGALTMAPEVEAGSTPTDRADMFGFGGLLARAVSRTEVCLSNVFLLFAPHGHLELMGPHPAILFSLQ